MTPVRRRLYQHVRIAERRFLPDHDHLDGQKRGVANAGWPGVASAPRRRGRRGVARRGAAVANALRPDASLRDVVRSYEKALAGDPFAEDDDVEEDANEAETTREFEIREAREERAYLEAYYAFLKVIRACCRLCVAGGDRRAAEDHARFAGRVAAAPSILLAHMPAAAVATACARAASVELAACGSAAWREVVRAKDAALAEIAGGDVFDADDDDAADAFFVDRGDEDLGGGDGGAARAAALAETLAEGAPAPRSRARL